jgi:hypothetical protein
LSKTGALFNENPIFNHIKKEFNGSQSEFAQTQQTQKWLKIETIVIDNTLYSKRRELKTSKIA